MRGRVARAGAGSTAPPNVDTRESMHPDRSSPSPVLAWYMPIPACSQAVPWQQQQHENAKQMTDGVAGWSLLTPHSSGGGVGVGG